MVVEEGERGGGAAAARGEPEHRGRANERLTRRDPVGAMDGWMDGWMMAGWLPHSVCLPQLDSQIGWLDERRELITEAAGMILHEEQCPTACLFPAMACVVGEAIAEARRGWPPRSGHTSWLDSFAVSRAPFAVGPLSRLLLGRWTRGRAREPSVSFGAG